MCVYVSVCSLWTVSHGNRCRQSQKQKYQLLQRKYYQMNCHNTHTCAHTHAHSRTRWLVVRLCASVFLNMLPDMLMYLTCMLSYVWTLACLTVTAVFYYNNGFSQVCLSLCVSVVLRMLDRLNEFQWNSQVTSESTQFKMAVTADRHQSTQKWL